MNDVLEIVIRLTRGLPPPAMRSLSTATCDGVTGLQRLRAQAGARPVRTACDQLIRLVGNGADPAFLAGALAATSAVAEEQSRASVEIVWTGPDTGQASTRLTLAVVTDLIAEARYELLLVSYAAHSDQHLHDALEAAASRGVDITLLLERHQDNPSYQSWTTPFAALDADRLAWPAEKRPPGAAMHAKILVVDDNVALVGSANLTSRAMERNLECGVVIRDHGAAQAIRSHVLQLREQGVFEPIPAG